MTLFWCRQLPIKIPEMYISHFTYMYVIDRLQIKTCPGCITFYKHTQLLSTQKNKSASDKNLKLPIYHVCLPIVYITQCEWSDCQKHCFMISSFQWTHSGNDKHMWPLPYFLRVWQGEQIVIMISVFYNMLHGVCTRCVVVKSAVLHVSCSMWSIYQYPSDFHNAKDVIPKSTMCI